MGYLRMNKYRPCMLYHVKKNPNNKKHLSQRILNKPSRRTKFSDLGNSY